MSAEAAVRVAVFLALTLGVGGTPAIASERVNLYAADGTRTGHAIVNRESGRVDYFDAQSRRTGYGTIDRQTGRAERFDSQGRRQPATMLPSATGTGRR